MCQNVRFRIVSRRLASVAAVLAMLCSTAPIHGEDPDATVTKEQRLEWFRQAKFGMFIHWGPYSRLAGEWQGKQLPVGTNCEWIMQKLQIPREDYREAARQFNPVKFDADAWADLAASTGMKYVVLTAKHHDGFAMYRSRVSKYNIVDYTPFGRDPLRELATACRKRGLKFCIYYSHREDWDEPFAYGNTWDFDFKPEDNLDLFESRYVETKAKPQLEELLTGYGPFGLVWFDRGMYTPEEGREFARLVWKHQPHCLVNGRVGNYNQELLGDYQNMNDNGMPIGGIEEYWETPQTLNETWGYSAFDHEWKRPEEVIRRLVEIVSRGGNYLLNIGPDGKGVVPEPSVEILQAVGHWVSANGESIYGTTASPFQELPWGYCTAKGKTLYLHVFKWPADRRLSLRGLRTAAKSAALLTDPANRLPIRQEDGSLAITLPNEPVDPVDTVVVLNLESAPHVDPPVVEQGADGTIVLDYIRAITTGHTVKRFNRKGSFHISKWTTPQDTILWHVAVAKPGRFEVKITYAADAAWAGQPYALEVAESRLEAQVQPTGASYEYKTLSLGTLTIDQPGRCRLVMRPAKALDHDLVYFKSLELTPITSEAATGRKELPLVILLGDSIRINYQDTVRAELEGKAEVWSPKDNCAHTLYTLENLDKWLAGRKPSVVHINVGLHDLFLNAKTGQPRHSLELYSANLRKIFARLKELTDAKIVFALTTPVDEERQASSKTYKRVVRRNPDIVQYNQRAAEIAKECGVTVDDVHTPAIEAGIKNVICDDGVHLTAKGKEVVGKQVARCVLSTLKER